MAHSYIKIHNWDKWQSYRKDRGQPPWIKLHRCLLRNPEWVSLTDAEKGQLVSIWLLAADKQGQIPHNASMVQKLCFLTSRPNLNKFIELGFLTSKTTPIWRQDDANVTPQSRIEESRNREEKNINIMTPERRHDDNHFDAIFERFWEAYPRKVGKQPAYKALQKLKPSSKLVEEILSALVKWGASEQWQDDRYIPHPATWLNQKRWEDELPKSGVERRRERNAEIISLAARTFEDGK